MADDKLREALQGALDSLRATEWAGYYIDSQGEVVSICPECGEEEQDRRHRECKLAAAIRAAEEALKQ